MTQLRNRRPATPKHASRCNGPLDELLDPAFFKALGDATRARLLACMAKCGRPCSVSEIAECCAVDLSVVSRHLALMARAGMLESVRVGRAVEYRVRFDDLVAALRRLADALETCDPDDDGVIACRARPQRGRRTVRRRRG